MRTDKRWLNRVTLLRQLLLRRHPVSTVEAIGRLVGLQAQAVNAPYLGLWSRLTDFTIADLTDRLHDREVVRASVLRGTQHLVRAEDYRWLRPLIAPPTSPTLFTGPRPAGGVRSPHGRGGPRRAGGGGGGVVVRPHADPTGLA